MIPDVVWISHGRLAAGVDEEGHFTIAPELIIEVLSPGTQNERRDRETKLKLYAERGVREYWILDWRTQQLEVYRRQEAFLRLALTLFPKIRSLPRSCLTFAVRWLSSSASGRCVLSADARLLHWLKRCDDNRKIGDLSFDEGSLQRTDVQHWQCPVGQPGALLPCRLRGGSRSPTTGPETGDCERCPLHQRLRLCIVRPPA